MKAVPVSLFERFHGLFDSISAPLVERFPMYAKAVQDHVSERGAALPASHGLHAALFIDCNQIKTNRPGGGPAGAGADAPRKDRVIQHAFYDGWGRNHGLKAEVVGAPTTSSCGSTASSSCAATTRRICEQGGSTRSGRQWRGGGARPMPQAGCRWLTGGKPQRRRGLGA